MSNGSAGVAAVDYDTWVKNPDGTPVPQSTADARIQSMVDLLDVKPGNRVLEIGTGSGYSAAVLAQRVGHTGHVVSIDIDPDLIARAARLHAGVGNDHVELHATDGIAGWASDAPYDRIVAWTTPHVVPEQWVTQTAPGGVIVTPVKIADIACANAVVRVEVGDEIRGGAVRPGSFIEMAPEVVTDLALPQMFVHASATSEGQAPWWISARVLHTQPKDAAKRLLDLAREATPLGEFLPVSRDKRDAFNAFVLSQTATPASLGTPNGWGIGVGLVDSIAVVLPDGSLLAAGSSVAHDRMAEWVDDWDELGEPGHYAMRAKLLKTAGGWDVRLQLRD